MSDKTELTISRIDQENVETNYHISAIVDGTVVFDSTLRSLKYVPDIMDVAEGEWTTAIIEDLMDGENDQ